jgi:serine/threonine protein kinase
VSPPPAAAKARPSADPDEAPTSFYDGPDDADPPTQVDAALVSVASSPWVAVGLRLGPGLLDSYRPVATVAAGDAIEAFTAEHAVLGRRVLVKVVTGARDDAELARAFLAESTLLWRLDHPSFPAVLEYGRDLAGTPYAVTELAAGESLADRLAAGPIPAAAALDIASQIASALTVAHARGIVHGALTAACVYLVPDSALPCGERVKIADFAAGASDGGAAAEQGADLADLAALLDAMVVADEAACPGTVASSLAALRARLSTGATDALSTMAEAKAALRQLELEDRLARPAPTWDEVRAEILPREELSRPRGMMDNPTLLHSAVVVVASLGLAALIGAIF